MHNLNLVDHRYSLSERTNERAGAGYCGEFGGDAPWRKQNVPCAWTNSSVYRCARESVCVDACVTALRKVVACVRVYRFSSSRCRSLLLPSPSPPHPVSIAMRLHQIADVSSRYLSANSTSV